MNRRDFFNLGAALLLGAQLKLPEHSRPQKQRNMTEPIIGHGDFRYKINLDWGKQDPAKYPVKDCHELVMDRVGRIYMTTNDTHNNILVFNKDGLILNAWGTEYPGAHGLTLADENGEEFLYITDYDRHEVIKTTLTGRVIRVFSFPADSGKYKDAAEFKPTETAIAPNGDVFIADGYGLDYVIQYDANGHLKNIFGGKGTEPGSLNNAHGIAIDHRNSAEPVLLVTSRAANALNRYTMDGRFLDAIQLPGAYICRPVVKGDHVFFAVLISHEPWDSQTGYILILDKDNKVVSCPGGSLPHYAAGSTQPDPMYQTVKVFKHPHDVLADNDGNLYVSQWNANQVYPARLERI
ncbi:MAG: 6-bladed beta-propeller [Bacteroidota bacterium]